MSLKVYFFSNGTGGGVLSVINNLLFFATNPNIESHIIYTINKDKTQNYALNHIIGSASESVFYYSSKWNFNYTCKKLAKVLTDENCLIVANDWLELAMVSHLGLSNRVIYILHGDYEYYYQLAFENQLAIDTFITVSNSIKTKLVSKLKNREQDIFYLPFPVPNSTYSNTEKQKNSIIFIGRCTKAKGYHLLPKIAELLKNNNIELNWHIVGAANEIDKFKWSDKVKVQFYGQLSNMQVMSLLCRMQLFILPSFAEGMPVSLIESMKAGTVPIMNNKCSDGIQELIINGETGFLSQNNLVEEYVAILQELVLNKTLIKKMSINAIEKANQLFNPIKNMLAYEDIFEKMGSKKILVKPITKIYGSRLDKTWIPNFITKTIRQIK